MIYLYINYTTLFNQLLVVFIITEFILMFNNWLWKRKIIICIFCIHRVKDDFENRRKLNKKPFWKRSLKSCHPDMIKKILFSLTIIKHN